MNDTRKWTPEQELGITTTGRSLLVSAAAGSGKTSILAARCVHLVCDAKPECEIDDLLVVTFTESAAAEMKSRIHSALRDRAEKKPSERLTRQLALVDQAQVSTLHSFCARLLRQHFHVAEIDAGFAVLAGDEAKLLRLEIARELFRKQYETDADGKFQRFIDAYGQGDDERLLHRIIGTHEMLNSLVDPKRWIDDARRQIREAADGPLENSDLGAELKRTIDLGLTSLRDRCVAALRQLRQLKGFEKYEEIVIQVGQAIKYWRETFETDGIDALSEVVKDPQWPALPRMSSSLPNKDLAKSIVDGIRDGVKSGPWLDILRFSTHQWQEGLKAILPHAQVFLNLVEEFDKGYRRSKDSLRMLDFSDLERFALKVLRDEDRPGLSPSSAAALCHQRYVHVLVDEYQDINEVQDAILSLVSRECLCTDDSKRRAKDGPNLFCVGDVKQSIYRFRLAEPGRFLGRLKEYRESAVPDGSGHGQVIDLRSNFRSRAPLLDAINGVFERLMTFDATNIQYDDSHRLVAQLDFPASSGIAAFSGSPIELHLLPGKLGASADDGDEPAEDDQELDRTEREALFVAHRIRQIMGMDGTAPMHVMENSPDGSLQPRAIRFKDIVILLRSMRHKADQFARVLELAGISAHADSSTGFFESMEVRDMLSLLQLLDNQRQDIPLVAVLRSPLAGIPHPEDLLARIRLAYPAGPNAISFHDAVMQYQKDHDDELAATLRDFVRQFDEWREIAQRRPLDELIWRIYQQSGYLPFCSGLRGGDQRVANLLSLHERAAQFGTFQRQGLSRFMRFIESLRDEADLGTPSIASEADDVVRLMSIHRAKGLEFPVVVLADLGKAINLQDCQGTILVDRLAGLGLEFVDEARFVRYPSLASTLVQARLRQQSLAEELRVLYVAMTRAREHLICVGSCGEKSTSTWQSRWQSHRGAFPVDAILGARCMLDWIGPVAAAAQGMGSPIFDLKTYEAEEIAAWQSLIEQRPTLSESQEQLAALKPLEPAPSESESAERVKKRLSSPYAFRQYTTIPSTQSVTSRTKSAGVRSSPGQPDHSAVSPLGKKLSRPRFLGIEESVSATDRGTATHLVLQHLDWTRPCDAKDIDVQIAGMIEQKFISEADVRLVNRDSVAWVIESTAGRLMRQHAANLRREIPVYFPVEVDPPLSGEPSKDPLDRTMVRGRLDVVIPLPDGAIVIDYKTDNVNEETLAGRVAEYAGQMKAYQEAFAQISELPVKQSYLVFLTPRKVIPV